MEKIAKVLNIPKDEVYEKSKSNTDLEKIKKYIDKLFLDKSHAYARNMNMPKCELQQILIGEMMHK